MGFTVATYNVNSIRKRLPIVLAWLAKHRPDVLCLQETKVQDADFPAEAFAGTGYHVAFRGMKAYNGVALVSRARPARLSYGLDDGEEPDEVRLLRAELDGLTVVTTYVPQGRELEAPQYAYKLRWFERLRAYFARHDAPDRPLVWVGDMNVAPEPRDVHDPEAHEEHVCYHVDARAAYKRTLGWGFEDVYRRLHPTTTQYTFWDYRLPNAVEADRGWRIDHILATRPLAGRVKEVGVDLGPRRQPNPSDHTVVWARFS